MKQLPEGLESHPQCRIKASVLQALISDVPEGSFDGLPSAISDIVRAPPPVSSWISHVHANAIVAALRDTVFDSDETFAGRCYRAQADLFSSRIYKMLMIAASPGIILRAVGVRWAAFNKGSSAITERLDRDAGTVRVEHPRGLFEASSRASVREALRATLELAGGRRHVAVQTASATPDGFSIEAAWPRRDEPTS